jgi:hypothetical protein
MNTSGDSNDALLGQFVTWKVQVQPTADELASAIAKRSRIELSEALDDAVLNNAKNKYGDKCNEHGYVFKNTMTLVSRTLGMFVREHFDGTPKYGVELSARVLKPATGMRITSFKLIKYTPGVGAELEAWPLLIFIESEHIKNKLDLDPSQSTIILQTASLKLEEPIRCTATLEKNN